MVDKSVSGTVSENPLTAVPLGSSLQFRRVPFAGSNANERAQRVTNWDYFNGSIVGLVLNSQAGPELVGTAVIVAPGLAVTATHAFIDKLASIQQGTVVPYCCGIREDSLDIWRVVQISYTGNSDIAFLSIEAASAFPRDGAYYQLGLTTRAPKNGEVLHIFGFRQEGLRTEAGAVELRANLYSSSGVVQAVYPYQRDSLLLPYPVIELNCGSLGGMSGGAAIDQNGLLVGVISRGLHTEKGDGPTYVSWIIKALGQSVKVPWPAGLHPGPMCPLSMDRRLLYIDRPEVMAGTDKGKIVYRIWFE